MAQLTFGNETIGLNTRQINEDVVAGYFQMGPTGGTLDSLRAYLQIVIGGAPFTINVKAAIYDSNKNLIASSNTNSYTSSTGGWKNFTFSSSLTLTANSYYYLAIWASGTT